MPRIALTKQQKLLNSIQKLTFQTEKQMLEYGIRKKDVAEVTNVSAAAVTQQFRNRRITIDTYMAVQMLIAEKGEQLNEAENNVSCASRHHSSSKCGLH